MSITNTPAYQELQRVSATFYSLPTKAKKRDYMLSNFGDILKQQNNNKGVGKLSPDELFTLYNQHIKPLIVSQSIRTFNATQEQRRQQIQNQQPADQMRVQFDYQVVGGVKNIHETRSPVYNVDVRIPAVPLPLSEDLLYSLIIDNLRARGLNHYAILEYFDYIIDYTTLQTGRGLIDPTKRTNILKSKVWGEQLQYFNGFIKPLNNPNNKNCAVQTAVMEGLSGDKIFDNLIGEDGSIIVEDFSKRATAKGFIVKVYDVFSVLIKTYEPFTEVLPEIRAKPSDKPKTLNICIIDNHAQQLTTDAKYLKRYKKSPAEELEELKNDIIMGATLPEPRNQDDMFSADRFSKRGNNDHIEINIEFEKVPTASDIIMGKFPYDARDETGFADQQFDADVEELYSTIMKSKTATKDAKIPKATYIVEDAGLVFKALLDRGVVGKSYITQRTDENGFDTLTTRSIIYKNDNLDIQIRSVPFLKLATRQQPQSPHTFNFYNYLISKLDNFKSGHLSETFVATYFPINTVLYGAKYNEIANKYIKIDRNKSHIASLQRPYKFANSIYLGNEQPECVSFETIDEMSEGVYYINSDNGTPNFNGIPLIKQSGWYSDDLIYYCIEKGYVPLSAIKYQLKPNRILPMTYFDAMIKHIQEVAYDNTEMKKLFVMFCGSLCRRVDTFGTTVYSSSVDDFNYFSTFKDIRITMPTNHTPYYSFSKLLTMPIYTHHFPIYSKIRENELIALDRIYNTLSTKASSVAFVYADSLVINNPTANYAIYLDAKIYGAFKLEELTQSRKTQIDKMPICCDAKRPTDEPKYAPLIKQPRRMIDTTEYCNETGRNEYLQIIEEAITNRRNMLIDAEAGHGKSELIKLLNKKFTELKIKTYILAPTNTASIKIGGKTNHHGFGININDPNICRGIKADLKNADVVMIDESYLISPDLLFYFQYLTQHKKQLLFFGDERQLIAIVEGWKPLTHTSFDILVDIKAKLATSLRYSIEDKATIDAIIQDFKKIEPLRISAKRPVPANLNRAICFYNRTRKNWNNTHATEYIKQNPKAKTLLITPIYDTKYTQEITIAEGMPIMAYKTKSSAEIFNGLIGNIKTISDDTITLKFDEMDEETTITHNEFRDNILVAFAITIYKSQGQTFDFPYRILDIETIKEIKGGLYSVLTRNKKLMNIYI